MNKRIKELAERARYFALDTIDVNCEGSLDESLDNAFEQMFAELIIKEAMYVGRLAQIKGQIVDSEIKDHFGVE